MNEDHLDPIVGAALTEVLGERVALEVMKADPEFRRLVEREITVLCLDDEAREVVFDQTAMKLLRQGGEK